MNVATAIKTLKEAFKNDPGYRQAWQANIAMAFWDEYKRYSYKKKYINGIDIHNISNKAADNFLKLLVN